MSVGEICNREVVVVQPEDTVLQAARLMRRHHVGSVLVVDQHNGKPVPVGIVTDRDLIVEVMATELDPGTITVSDIMVPDFAIVKEETGVFETIQYMRNKSVRRLPVVDKEGRLIGIIALDDLLSLLSEELDALAKLVAHEQKKETNTRR